MITCHHLVAGVFLAKGHWEYYFYCTFDAYLISTSASPSEKHLFILLAVVTMEVLFRVLNIPLPLTCKYAFRLKFFLENFSFAFNIDFSSAACSFATRDESLFGERYDEPLRLKF